MISENIRRFLATGLGLAIFTTDRIREMIQELVRQGEVSREEGERLLDDILRRAQSQSNEMRTALNEGLSRFFERTGLARQEEIERLKQRIEELERRLQSREEAEADEENLQAEGAEEGDMSPPDEPAP